MHTQQSSEPREAPRDVVQLARLVCQPEDASVLGQKQRGVSFCECYTNIGAQNICGSAGIGDRVRFGGGGTLEIAFPKDLLDERDGDEEQC